MTFTITSLRTDVLADLRDTTNLTWSNAQIDRAIAQALDRYAGAAPRPQTATLTGITGRTVDLSAAAPGGLGSTDYAALIRVVAVEYPLSQWPLAYVRFEVFAPTLSLVLDSALSSDSLKLYYLLTHTLDAASGTVPNHHRELLNVGAQAYALRQSNAANANALTSYTTTSTDTHYRAEERMAQFDEQLRRLRAHITQRSLFRPSEPYLNRDTVQFPD